MLSNSDSRNLRFNTANKKVRHWKKSWASSIHLPSSQQSWLLCLGNYPLQLPKYFIPFRSKYFPGNYDVQITSFETQAFLDKSWASDIFWNGKIYEKHMFSIQSVFQFYLQHLFETFFVPTNISRLTVEMRADSYACFHIKCSLFVIHINQKLQYIHKG
jgi:hypothetical protein